MATGCSTCECSKKRKKLYGASSSDVCHVLQSLAAVHGVEIIDCDETSSSLYLCRKCCTLIEKVFKLRRQLQVFENTIVERLKCSTVVKRKESVDVAEEGK